MARELLLPLLWRRHYFVAEVGRRGATPGGPVLLLCNLTCAESGVTLAEHVWVVPPDDPDACLRLGRRVRFRATVRPYRREDGTEDYELRGLRNLTAAGSVPC